LSVLAKNFCRAFSLNQTMYISLVHHLKDSLDKYHADQIQAKKGDRLPNLDELGYSYSNIITSSGQLE
jgi:hypothetical protein